MQTDLFIKTQITKQNVPQILIPGMPSYLFDEYF